MNHKILVAYASRAGSTAEIAAEIGKTLTNKGAQVDVLPIKEVADLSSYQSVVIGSAVRIGSWLPEAVKFIQTHKDILSRVPTSVFAVHIMNMENDEKSRAARQMYLDPVRKLITPRKEACFNGVGDLAKVSFIERMVGKMVKSAEGDFRDWNAIRAWAESL